MTIAATQLRKGLAHYLSMTSKEEIIVTKNGKFYVSIIGVLPLAVQSVTRLFGIIPPDVDGKSIFAYHTSDMTRKCVRFFLFVTTFYVDRRNG